jgi:trigger factor
LKVSREDTAPRQVVLTVELDDSDLEPSLERSYRRVVNRVVIPGFRKGKAPRYLVQNYLGREALIQESLDHIVQEALDKALKEHGLEVFGEPELDLVETDPVSFRATLPLEPLVDLGDFRDVRLQPAAVEVTDERVDEVIERLRYDTAPWQPVERGVKFGDLVTLDATGVIAGDEVMDDKGVDFIPNQDNPSPFPGFSVYLEGMNRDEDREFTLAVPEDYLQTAIAGKECRFSVKVLEIKEKGLADLDDEFAKGVGEGYETMEELRTSVLDDLKEQSERAAQRELESKALDEVIKGASVQMPDLAMDREIDRLMDEQIHAQHNRHMDMDEYLQNVGKSQDELKDELRPAAQERLTRYLIVREIAKEEGIEVSADDIDSEVERLTSGVAESAEALRRAFSSESARTSIHDTVLTRRTLGRLREIVTGAAGEAETAAEPPTGSAEESGEQETAEESAPSTSEETPAETSDEEGGNSGDNES